MTEATGEKKPAQGGLVERCWSAMFQQSDQPFTLGSHGGRVCENRLIEWVRRGAACFCVFGALQGLAQAGGLYATGAAIEQIPITLSYVSNTRAMRPAHANEAVAHLVSDSVVLGALVTRNGEPMPNHDASQAGYQRESSAVPWFRRHEPVEVFKHVVVSFCIGFALGWFGLLHWLRRWF